MSAVGSLLGLFPSFVVGNRVIDGGDLAQMASLEFSTKAGITAAVGGGVTNATLLGAAHNQIDVCGSDNDSVKLPQAIPGTTLDINNNTSHTLAVFGAPTNPVTNTADVIQVYNSTTTATSQQQPQTVIGLYVCYVAGIWKQGLMR